MYTQTDLLRWRLNSYAALSFLVLLLCGALMMGIPLREGGENSARQLLTVLTTSRVQSVAGWADHSLSVVWHIALRPGVRALLERGEAENDKSNALLAASMGITGDTAALSLYNGVGRRVAHSGVHIPDALCEEALRSDHPVFVSAPFGLHSSRYMLFSVPITANASHDAVGAPFVVSVKGAEIIGRVLLLRDLSALEKILAPTMGAIVPASCVLFMNDSMLGTTQYKADKAFQEGSQRALRGDRGIVASEDMVYCYAPVNTHGWGLVAAVPLSVLHAPVNRQFWTFMGATVLVYIICMAGFIFLSRPLTGKILMRAHELEKEIDERRNAQEELEKAHALLQEAYEQRRELAGNILATLEQLRSEMATELHDNAGQQLTTLLLSLDYAQKRLQAGKLKPAAFFAVLDRAAKQVQALQKDIRRMSHGLFPPALNLAGLSHTIKQLCKDFENGGLRIHCDATPLPATSEETALSLYRITQECLTNIVRHAAATEVFISLQLRENIIYLTIEDNGRGFTLPAKGLVGHLGLRLIQERAQYCNGTVTIETAPGEGTLVLVELPL
jgi:signal transduction histidine kinase